MKPLEMLDEYGWSPVQMERVAFVEPLRFAVPYFIWKMTMMTVPFLLIRQELILGAQHTLLKYVIELRLLETS